MTFIIDAMRHYLNYEEFKEFVLRERVGEDEFSLFCEDNYGDTEVIRFRDYFFIYRIILYTLPNCLDIGIIQEDIDNGWDEAIRDVLYDITQTCGWKPYFLVESENKNLFN